MSCGLTRHDRLAETFKLIHKMNIRGIILVITLSFILYACVDSNQFDNNITENFLRGSWKVDSVQKLYTTNDHPRIEAVQFNEDEIIWQAYYFRQNKIYEEKTNLGFKLQDSLLIFPYDSISFEMTENFNHYRINKLDNESIRLNALFETKGSTPPMDSVIWYSKINDSEEYLSSFIVEETNPRLDIYQNSTENIYGLWSMDSIVHLKFTEFENDKYVLFEKNDSAYFISLDENHISNEFRYELQHNKFLFDGKTFEILYLDSNRLRFGVDNLSDFHAVHFSRIGQKKDLSEYLRNLIENK